MSSFNVMMDRLRERPQPPSPSSSSPSVSGGNHRPPFGLHSTNPLQTPNPNPNPNENDEKKNEQEINVEDGKTSALPPLPPPPRSPQFRADSLRKLPQLLIFENCTKPIATMMSLAIRKLRRAAAERHGRHMEVEQRERRTDTCLPHGCARPFRTALLRTDSGPCCAERGSRPVADWRRWFRRDGHAA